MNETLQAVWELRWVLAVVAGFTMLGLWLDASAPAAEEERDATAVWSAVDGTPVVVPHQRKPVD